jgi:hypothetical protein
MPRDRDAVLNDVVHRFKRSRVGDGKWSGYPYYYTLSALSGIDLPLVKTELKYASKAAEGLIQRNKGDYRESRFRRFYLEAALNAV